MSEPTSFMRSVSNDDGRSVVIAWAAISTFARRPCLAAYDGETRTAAAAPQVGGQHCRRVSGPKIFGELSTSSSEIGSRKTEYGLLAAWERALTAMRAKTSGFIPYFSAYAAP